MYILTFKDQTQLDIDKYFIGGFNGEGLQITVSGKTYEELNEFFSDSSKTAEMVITLNGYEVGHYYSLTKVAGWNINPSDNTITVTMQIAGFDEQITHLQNSISDTNKAVEEATTKISTLDSQINPVFDVDVVTLDEYKNYRQEENKKALKDFLARATITYNENEYGVSQEDQDEMALQLLSYQTAKAVQESPILEWHSKKKACVPFTEEQFVELSVMVKAFVYPYMQQMQQIKESIFNCSTKDEVTAIEIFSA